MDKNTGFTSLIDTLKQNKDVIADACDAGLEAAESIPFVGWALKLWNVKNTYQERKLYRNTKAFWEASLIKDPEALRTKFATQEAAEEFTDTLVQVLIDSEKPYKATMVSNVTNALALGRLTHEEANDMILIILNASVPALKSLPKFHLKLHGGKYIATALLEDTDKDGTHSMLNSMGLIYRWADQTALSKVGRNIAQIAYRGL
ncbi:hypothetical protein AI2912V1_1970 [Klebsiella pneumoniae]|nr:hypothetical protein AH0329V1_1434 [Klebsiella pneumoniae]CAF2775286.1 hypothetical protein AI2929V1_1435 [Klebsiella pneumoniae]CAF3278706.1 hypothetical protein AI3028V1_1433 [Klebsiella pneumoniae]CAF9402857.1 hypothetical protein AI2917V1_1434 [Klebsiella pneumoniae]CAF9403437.1 hypothetical protein AI2906V1_1434 [Klebsiella pneumoniae]